VPLASTSAGRLKWRCELKFRRRDHHGAAKLLRARADIQSVQAMDVAGISAGAACSHAFLGLGFDVERIRRRIDNRCAGNANLWKDVVCRQGPDEIWIGSVGPSHGGNRRYQRKLVFHSWTQDGESASKHKAVMLRGKEDHIVCRGATKRLAM